MNTTHTTILSAVVIAVVLGIAGSASPAQAQPPGNNGRTHIQGVRIDIHGDFGWWWALGVGVRAEIPLLKEGFVDTLDDEFAISFGGEFMFLAWNGPWNGGGCNGYGCWGDWSAWPLVTVQWDIYINDKWSVFPELGGTVGFYDCGPAGARGVCVTGSPIITAGAHWHFAPPRVGMSFRLTYPYGLSVGIFF